jgi:type IV secretory pathway TrbL component
MNINMHTIKQMATGSSCFWRSILLCVISGIVMMVGFVMYLICSNLSSPNYDIINIGMIMTVGGAMFMIVFAICSEVARCPEN